MPATEKEIVHAVANAIIEPEKVKIPMAALIGVSTMSMFSSNKSMPGFLSSLLPSFSVPLPVKVVLPCSANVCPL